MITPSAPDSNAFAKLARDLLDLYHLHPTGHREAYTIWLEALMQESASVVNLLDKMNSEFPGLEETLRDGFELAVTQAIVHDRVNVGLHLDVAHDYLVKNPDRINQVQHNARRGIFGKGRMADLIGKIYAPPARVILAHLLSPAISEENVVPQLVSTLNGDLTHLRKTRLLEAVELLNRANQTDQHRLKEAMVSHLIESRGLVEPIAPGLRLFIENSFARESHDNMTAGRLFSTITRLSLSLDDQNNAIDANAINHGFDLIQSIAMDEHPQELAEVYLIVAKHFIRITINSSVTEDKLIDAIPRALAFMTRAYQLIPDFRALLNNQFMGTLTPHDPTQEITAASLLNGAFQCLSRRHGLPDRLLAYAVIQDAPLNDLLSIGLTSKSLMLAYTIRKDSEILTLLSKQHKRELLCDDLDL